MAFTDRISSLPTVSCGIRAEPDNTVMAQEMTETWNQWQRDVVALLRKDFSGTLPEIGLDDVDWPSWHTFFVQGRTPRSAIERAFERDL